MSIIESEGVANPAGTKISLLAAETWQEFVRTVILLSMHNKVCVVGDLQKQPFMGGNFGFIKREFDHHVTEDDIREVIREMYRIGLIEPAQYKCECCKDKQHTDILGHVTAFKMTILGKSLIPERLSS